MKFVVSIVVFLSLQSLSLGVEDEWSTIFQQLTWERQYTNQQINLINYKTSSQIGQSITSYLWQLIGIQIQVKASDAECALAIRNQLDDIFRDIHQLDLCRNYPEINALRASQLNKLDQQHTVLSSAKTFCHEDEDYQKCYDKITNLVRSELDVIRKATDEGVSEIAANSNECIKETNGQLVSSIKDVSQRWDSCKNINLQQE